MGERLRHILVKEFIQLFRDPRMRAVVLLTPFIQLVVLGYAVTTDIAHIATAVVDLDRSQESRELVRRFAASGYFEIVRRTDDARALRDLLDRGVVKAAIQLDPGFARDLRRGHTAQVQILVDGSDSNTASVVNGYASRVVGQYAQDATARATETRRIGLGPAAGAPAHPAPGGVELRSRSWYNPDLRSQNFYVPGIIAILLMLTSLLLTSMAIVREREAGTMEQLLVTPLRPVELILGKTLPFAIVGFFDVAVITAIAVSWFQVPLRGNLVLLFVSTALYLLPALGIGLFISTISRTQQQALMTTFFFFQPAMLLSGFVFPIANMPEPIQVLTYVNPLRYFLVVIRGIFLKGNGLDVLWRELLALLAIGIVVFTLATLRFTKRLE